MALSDLKDVVKQIPLTEGISRYIPVEKKGTKSVAICPFHDDHDPSLQIDEEKGFFMCFVCQTGGDFITFVEKFKNLDFKDALRDISEKFAIPYDDYVSTGKVSPQLEMGRKILHKAALIYQKFASEGASQVFQKFLEDRKVSADIATRFEMGVAPSGNIFWSYLNSIPNEKSRDAAIKMAIEIGMIRVNKDNGSHYDTFRDRIMFPIWDQYGKVVGFGGRAIHDYQKAKYLNSFDSFLFNKKNIAYGLHIAKPSIRQKNAVILTEGYMDTIALHQVGIDYAIAVMGVGLSEYMAQSISGLTKNIFLALDSDKAGMMAMERINAIFLAKGILPRFIDFSPFKDPDDFLKNRGSVELLERIDNAKTFLDMQLEKVIPNPVPALSDQKIKVLEQAFALLSPLESGLSATERIVQVAKNLQINTTPDLIIENYKEYLKSLAKKNSAYKSIEVEEEVFQPIAQTDPELTSGEKLLIKQILLHPDTLEDARMSEILDLITNFGVKQYISNVENLYFEVDEFEFLKLLKELHHQEGIPKEVGQIVGSVLYQYRSQKRFEKEQLDKFFLDLKKRITEDALIHQKKNLKAQSAHCRSENEMQNLMREIMIIDKKLNDIRSQKLETSQ